MLMLWDFYVCSLLPMANWAEIQAFVLYLSFEWSLMVNYRWQSWAETALPCCRPDVDLYNCLFYSLTDQSQWHGMSIVLYENAERGHHSKPDGFLIMESWQLLRGCGVMQILCLQAMEMSPSLSVSNLLILLSPFCDVASVPSLLRHSTLNQRSL